MPRYSYSQNRYPDNWDDIRRAVLKRDNYTCANYPNCPDTPDAKILQAHHIIPLSLGGTNNMSNLKTVCRACHMKLHPHMMPSDVASLDDETVVDEYGYYFDADGNYIEKRGGVLKTILSGSFDRNSIGPPVHKKGQASRHPKLSEADDHFWRTVIVIGVFIALGYVLIFVNSNQFSSKKLNASAARPDPSVTVHIHNERPLVYAAPDSGCHVVKNLGSEGTVLVTGWTVSDGEIWYRIDSGEWLNSSNVWQSERHAAQETRHYDRVPSCVTSTATPMPSATPTRIRQPTPTDTQTSTTNASNCVGGCIQFPAWCAPPIKGNVSYNSGERIYHVPGQEYYDETKINPRYGERWFCTEAEAQEAGWRKSKR